MRVTGIKRPLASGDSTIITYGTNGVTQVVRDGVTTNYSRTLSGSAPVISTMVVTQSTSTQNLQTTVVSDMTKYRPTSVVSVIGMATQTTALDYDALGRPKTITNPEGDMVVYDYDTRGNVKTTTRKSKSGSSPDLVTTANYSADPCGNPVTCNSPTWTKDAKGNQTDYEYDSTTGQVTRVMLPPASSGATRPEVRYSYTTVSTVSVLTGTSTCQNNAAPGCVGTADEVKTTIEYNPNLLPTKASKGNGTGTLTAIVANTYDPIGNLVTSDGPLPGGEDTTTWRWSADRENVGTISPDPDGGGILNRRAVKTTPNADGFPYIVEIGTVTGTTDPYWANFSSLQKVTRTYDVAKALPTRSVLTSGTTTYQVSEYKYDVLNRPLCGALRMDSANWNTPLTDTCVPGTGGSFGPDRVTKNSYDQLNRVTEVRAGVGTAAEAVQSATAFTANGRVNTLTDGRGNTTTYEYDGYDRLVKTRYPSTTAGSGASSTTDYEQLTLDANGNVTQRRLRDGNTLGYAIDGLDRVYYKNPSSGLATSYGYDLLGRLTGAATTAQALSFGYDALNRVLTQTGPRGTMSSQYDLAGRQTILQWPDGFYAQYDHLVTGETSFVRENGATTGVGVLAAFVYDDLGNRTQIVRGNTSVTNLMYDPVSRLSSLEQNVSGTAQDVTFGYSYTPSFQIATNSRTNGVYSWTGSSGSPLVYTNDGLNRLTGINGLGVSTSVGYDARSNVTSAGPSSYGYTIENLLTSGPGTTLSYDPLLRLYQETGAATTQFQYNGQDMVTEYDAGGTVQRRYVFGGGIDEPLVWYEGSGASDRRWLHTDERGSVITITNGSAVSIGTNTYDEYGTPAASNLGRFGYTGQAWLPDLRLWYYKARVYNPALGRFMQTDPIGYDSGMNIYAYVGGDPVNLSDPSGTCLIAFTLYGSKGEVPEVVVRPCPEIPFEPKYTVPGSVGEGGSDGGAAENTCLGPNGISAAGTAVAIPARGAIGEGLLAGIEAGALRALGTLGALLSLSGDTPQPQYVIRGGITTPDSLIRGTTSFTYGGTRMSGFSVTSAPGMSVNELAAAAGYPNRMISYSTVTQLAAVGAPVATTPLSGQPLHSTVTARSPLSAAQAAKISSVFSQQSNPARCP